jgi:acetyl-CoA synthetase
MNTQELPPESLVGNMSSYEEAYRNFSWVEEEKRFTWSATGNLNIVHEAVDRWAEDSRTADKQALIIERRGGAQSFTFRDLRDISSRWANMFMERGLGLGDRVFIFLPACPELYFAMLACARLGIVFYVMFPRLDHNEIEAALKRAAPRAMVVHSALAERIPLNAGSSLECVFFVEGSGLGQFASEISTGEAVETYSSRATTRWVEKDTPLYLIYTTSGGTSPPKGIIHAHGDMVGHSATARLVLNINEDSILWTDGGEPGWVAGVVYGAFAPWLCGASVVCQTDSFSASTWYRTIERRKVTVWHTTPRTIARLMEAGEDVPGRYDLRSLTHIATAGETLSPDRFFWAKRLLGPAPLDTYWMTETGMICLANFSCMEIKPGSMGRPAPGVEAAILDEDGLPLPPGRLGELAIRPTLPALMIGIVDDAPRYREYFRVKGWFLTGDMAVMDQDGYFFHQGRNDDLIKIGQRDTGPYEIERVLMMHAAVAEAIAVAVRGPDGVSRFKAFVRVTEGTLPSRRLASEIVSFLKADHYPDAPIKNVVFLKELPKTRSGILLHSALVARELE